MYFVLYIPIFSILEDIKKVYHVSFWNISPCWGRNHLKLTEKAIIHEKAYLYSQNELFEVETNYHKKV